MVNTNRKGISTEVTQGTENIDALIKLYYQSIADQRCMTIPRLKPLILPKYMPKSNSTKKADFITACATQRAELELSNLDTQPREFVTQCM